MTADIVIDFVSPAGIQALRDEIVDAYVDAYWERQKDPFRSVENYWSRVTQYSAAPGFTAVTGRRAGGLECYSFGFPLPVGARWWNGLVSDVDSLFLEETGCRTFALAELAVRRRSQRRGCARALHDSLLRQRPEERATLFVRPGNAPATSAYRRWGWRKIGEIQPTPESPHFDAMLLPLDPLRRGPISGELAGS